MKKVIGLMFVVMLTGCACARSKREERLAKALKDTNRELTWSRDQNEAYSRELHLALIKLRKKSH